MAANAPVSHLVAFDPGDFMASRGYYNPTTLEPIAEMEALQLIQHEHSLGLAVVGVDDISVSVPELSFDDGPISPQQNQANLDFAADFVIAQNGLTNFPASEWTPEWRKLYIDKMRGYILAHPELFTNSTFAVAQAINTNRDFSQSTWANYGVAITDTVQNAVDALKPSLPGQAIAAAHQAGVAITDAVKAAAGMISKSAAILEWVLPVAAVGIVWYAVKSIGKDPGGQTGKFLGSGAKAVATFL